MIELITKSTEVLTGGPLIAIINHRDAELFGLHHTDRIRIKHGQREILALIDLAFSEEAVPRGHVALNIELIKKLKLKPRQKVQLIVAPRPKSVTYIRKKLDGHALNEEEIRTIVRDTVSNALSDVELTYFIAGSYTHGFTMKETIALTKAMVDEGEVLKLDEYPVIDKHCIGGVAGNRTTMVVVPILAAAGLFIPKTSSRSITSPAGTADTMEVLANVTIDVARMKKIVDTIGACIVWGGALNLAPADDKFIRVEHPLNIDAEGQLLASIIAKKRSVSASHVLIDLPVGRGSKIHTVTEARRLGRKFQQLGKKLGMKVQTVVTDGSQPIGNGIGPSLEARDVLYVLRNDYRQPFDLRDKSLMLAGLMLEMAGRARRRRGRQVAEQLLNSGKAYDKMVQIIRAQGGKEVSPDDIRIGKFKADVKAKHRGMITHISNMSISRTARRLGAPLDKASGIYLYKHAGERVQKGDIILTMYSDNRDRLTHAIEFFESHHAIFIEPKRP